MKPKKLISMIAAAAMLLSIVSVGAAAVPLGTAVKTAEQLMNLQPDGDYYLTRDIDLAGVDWKPIKDFSGSFDGNGHAIKNLHSETYGLFSTLKSGAKVSGVTLTDVYITSKFRSIGALAAEIGPNEKNVVVEECSVSGVVASCLTKYRQYRVGEDDSAAGAIVGVNRSPSSTISGCRSNAIVAAEISVGGIVGENQGTVEECGFEGQLIDSYNVYNLRCKPGELMTEDYAYLKNSGGIAGENHGNILRCFNNGKTAAAVYTGGIVGCALEGRISQCVNSAFIPAGSEEDYLWTGLIAGFAEDDAVFSDCYTRMPASKTFSDNAALSSADPIEPGAQSDIGKGKTGTTTYGVSAENYSDISYFKKLGEGWTIDGGVPVLSRVQKLKCKPSVWQLEGERIKKQD